MPLARYQIRNEYSLADSELYRAADKDDPEALLEGVAMAGLVGVLRQLGDLAQFAAEIFHDLHEEVMATAARGHGLMARVQQLEAEIPSLEKAFLSQTHHSSFFFNGGIDWHPNLRSEQNLITQEDLPRFVMDSYEDCRGPPRLFLLDKFDVAGAGACLKRYTDPSFFKLESVSSKTATAEIHREKRSRRLKQKKAARLRNGGTPEVVPTHAKLHQLLLEENIENAYSNPARLVKLKKRQLNGSGVEAKTGKSYMEKFLESPSPECKMVCETSIIPLPVKSMSEDTSEAGIKILEISTVSPVKRSLGNENTPSSPNEQESELKPSSEMEMETNGDLVKVHEQMLANVTDELSYNCMKTPVETELADDGQKKLEACLDGYHSDDANSEVENYMDALTTMESEMETDNECRPKNNFLNIGRLTDSDGKEEHQPRAQFSISQSFGDSSTSDESSSFKQDRNDECNELRARLSDSQSIGTSITLEENSSFKRQTGEEHMELQAQFSDSQSVGNSSASEEISVNRKDTSCFSHSDSLGIMVENIKSEPLLLPSTKYFEYETEDTPSDHLSQIVESQKPDYNKLVMHDDAQFQKEKISDSGRAASDSSLMNSGHLTFCSDLGANLPVIQPTETQLVETTFDTVKLQSTLAGEDRKCPVEPNAVVPAALSIVKDDACPVSSENYPLNYLDDSDPCVQSGASLQISNDLELAPMIVPTGTQLLERPSEPVGLHSSLADDEERKSHVESVAAVPDALSIMKDDACPVVSSKEHPLYNFDDGDPYVHSDASLQTSNDLELALVVVPTATQLDETSSEPVELNLSLADDVERNCHVESIAAAPNAFSVTKDGACPVVSCEEYSLNLDDGEPYANSDASLQISNDLIMAPVDECSDHSKIKVLQAGFSNENSAEILASREVSSSGEHTIRPFMEEVDFYSGTTQPLDGAEVLDSKAEDCIIASKLNSEDSSPAVETPPASSLTREQFSYFTHETPKDEPDLVGVEVLYSDRLSNSEETSRMEHGNEKNGSTCSVDAVEDDGHLKQLSFPGFLGQGNHVNVNNVFTEKVQSEDQAASAASVDSGESSASIVTCPASNLIPSSSRNLANLQEPFPGSSDSDQLEMESSKVESTEIFRDLNAETRKNQLEPSSDIISSNIVSSSMKDPPNLQESLSSLRDPHANEIEFNEAVARESLTELEAQMVVDQPEVASDDVGLGLNRSVSHDLSDSETSNTIQDSSLKGKSQYISSANDVSIVPEFSALGTQELESSSCQNNSLPSPSYNQLELEAPSKQFLQSQAGQQDADFLLRVEENSASEKFQSEHIHVPNQLGQERKSLAASESALEMHLDQPSSFDSLSQSADQEISATKHVMDSLKPLPDPFPEVSEINLGEMAPMPPLPPMQWRKGKAQHASQREVIEVSQASFQPIQAIKTDEKGQFGLLTSQRETLQYQNPFLPVMAVEGDKIQYSSGFSVGASGHPVAVPFQFPFMVNEANGQYNYLILERSQIQNPFLTLPVVSAVRPPHGYILASEGEMVQYSNPCPPMPPIECAVSGHDPVSSQDKLTQSPSQLVAETTSKAEELKHSLGSLEGEQGGPSVTPMTPPSMEIVQHNHSLPPLEGEMASPLDIYALTSEFEGEKPNGIPKNKLPRPRNPLIDAVASHDKSKLRKVTQRARPETAPKIDERDSLLEQIRTKSFNLKPAVATRPSIQGPNTNLKVAAILEKANAIRQALAGSDDEDDDADRWSDS